MILSRLLFSEKCFVSIEQSTRLRIERETRHARSNSRLYKSQLTSEKM